MAQPLDWDIVMALVKAVELKDQSTAAHTWRVALYTKALAEAAGVDQANIERFVKAAVLHDVGKIDIPQRVLAKPGRLTDAEYQTIKGHTTLGYDRLVRMGENDPIVLGLVRSHHERMDGSGYPDGLVGDAIPLPARWFMVIDSFDAMTSIRPYRSTVGERAAARAIEELRRRADAWYCPEAVERFAGLFESSALDWILHHFNDRGQMASLSSIPDFSAIERVPQSPPEVIVKPTAGEEVRPQ